MQVLLVGHAAQMAIANLGHTSLFQEFGSKPFQKTVSGYFCISIGSKTVFTGWYEKFLHDKPSLLDEAPQEPVAATIP